MMYSPRSVSTTSSAGALEARAQPDLLGDHRLALGDDARARLAADAEDDVAGVGAGRRPVHARAGALARCARMLRGRDRDAPACDRGCRGPSPQRLELGKRRLGRGRVRRRSPAGTSASAACSDGLASAAAMPASNAAAASRRAPRCRLRDGRLPSRRRAPRRHAGSRQAIPAATAFRRRSSGSRARPTAPARGAVASMFAVLAVTMALEMSGNFTKTARRSRNNLGAGHLDQLQPGNGGDRSHAHWSRGCRRRMRPCRRSFGVGGESGQGSRRASAGL